MAGLSTFLRQLTAMWRTWPMGRQLSVVLSLVIGVGGLLGLVYWGSQVVYAPLMSPV